MDADNGVVKILKKNDGESQSFDPQHYVRTFETEGTPLLFQYISGKYYNPPQSLSICPLAGVRTYMHLEAIAEIENKGRRFFFDAKSVREVLERTLNFLDEIEVLATEYDQKRVLTRHDVKKMFALFSSAAQGYSHFDVAYTDAAYEAYGGMNEGLKIAEEGKNVIREKVNFSFFDPHGGYKKFLAKVAKMNGDVLDHVSWYSEEEMYRAVDGKRVPTNVIAERKELYVLYQDASGEMFLWQGEKAKRMAQLFEKTYDSHATSFLGRAAYSTGQVVRGKAVIINSDYTNPKKVDQKMAAMKQGDILFSVTTAPDLMPAMRKAGAIITDLGGMLSHAAITARELGTPCIVGTEYASKVLHDGDMVEVDAEKGVVRVIERTV